MKLWYAALFSGCTLLASSLYSALVSRPGLRLQGVMLDRRVWLAEHSVQWELGWWLWLLFIFSWMLLLVVLMWRYSPAHRVATMLQSGLMLISAVLAIGACLVWMKVIPAAAAVESNVELLNVIDMLVLALAGAGCFMGGIVTAWMGVDLGRLERLPWPWLLPAIVAGLCAATTPFLLPQPHLLIVAAVCWLGWCAFLSTRREEPKVFAAWL
ncbi:MAG: hypothetical protein KDE50_28115 [Caldilineaceae bacterium]|nr:hypothetical protein [Caldilineaceae bacterium]